MFIIYYCYLHAWAEEMYCGSHGVPMCPASLDAYIYACPFITIKKKRKEKGKNKVSEGRCSLRWHERHTLHWPSPVPIQTILWAAAWACEEEHKLQWRLLTCCKDRTGPIEETRRVRWNKSPSIVSWNGMRSMSIIIDALLAVLVHHCICTWIWAHIINNYV
jgi:hypothetical protein